MPTKPKALPWGPEAVPGVAPTPVRPAVVASEAADVRELARQHTPRAIDALLHIAEHGESETARVSAATAILDRGWGKPTERAELEVTARRGPDLSHLSVSDLEELLRLTELAERRTLPASGQTVDAQEDR